MTEGNPMKTYTLYSEEINAPIYFCGFDEEITFNINTHDLEPLIESYLDNKGLYFLYRATQLDNLNLVLTNGIDSDKPNQGFWGNRSLSKCLEYGKLIMCYEDEKFKTSWREYDLNSLSENESNSLKENYLSFEVNQDKTKIFFSMFPEEKRGRVNYEMSHGYYLPEPENQKDCLKGVILLGSGENWFPNLITKFYTSGGTLKKDGQDLIDMGQLKEQLEQMAKQDLT